MLWMKGGGDEGQRWPRAKSSNHFRELGRYLEFALQNINCLVQKTDTIKNMVA